MNVKDIIIFFAGMGIGAAGAYFAVKDKFQKKADEEISEMRNYVKNKIAECNGKTTAYKEQLDQYKLVTGDEDDSDYAEDRGEMYKYIKEYEVESAENEHPMDDDEYAEYRDMKAQQDREPRIITEDEFADYPHHDKETLIYYVEDETLCDEDMHIVDDADRLFGMLLEDFYDDDDMKEVFVRNVSMGADYYIKKEFDSYDHATS